MPRSDPDGTLGPPAEIREVLPERCHVARGTTVAGVASHEREGRCDGRSGRRAGRPRFHLHHSRGLDAQAAGRVGRAAHDLPLTHTVGGARSCPADDGSVAVIVLSYPDRPDVDLWLGLTGCAMVSNGHIQAMAGDLREAVLAGGSR